MPKRARQIVDALLRRESIGDVASEQREAEIGQQILGLLDQVDLTVIGSATRGTEGGPGEAIEQIRALAQELVTMHGEPDTGFEDAFDVHPDTLVSCDNCGSASHHAEECPYGGVGTGTHYRP
jgi:hypothetical protein